MRFTVIIPARYNSTRLPGKMLLEIAGKPMLQHVYERALQSGATKVVIATEDKRIETAASAWGAQVCITSDQHHSGTERLAETVAQLGCDDNEIIVNLQGDEPLMHPKLVHQAAMSLATNSEAHLATLCEPIHDVELVFNPNVVKVVMNAQGYALYFSRAPIAWDRENFADDIKSLNQSHPHYRHIGVYAYRAAFLREYSRWPVCPLEQMESLEQLRVLWHSGRIHVAIAVEKAAPSVDTAQDLTIVRTMIAT